MSDDPVRDSLRRAFVAGWLACVDSMPEMSQGAEGEREKALQEFDDWIKQKPIALESHADQ